MLRKRARYPLLLTNSTLSSKTPSKQPTMNLVYMGEEVVVATHIVFFALSLIFYPLYYLALHGGGRQRVYLCCITLFYAMYVCSVNVHASRKLSSASLDHLISALCQLSLDEVSSSPNRVSNICTLLLFCGKKACTCESA